MPISPAGAVAASVVNLVLLLGLGAGVVADVLSPGQVGGTWVAVLSGLTGVVAVALLGYTATTLRRRHYLVHRPALLGAPAGGFLARSKGQQR